MHMDISQEQISIWRKIYKKKRVKKELAPRSNISRYSNCENPSPCLGEQASPVSQSEDNQGYHIWTYIPYAKSRSLRYKCPQKKSFTSCNPHHDISRRIFGHIFDIFGQFIWHIFWHSIWNIFWHPIWHMFWHCIWQFIWHIFWHSIWHSFWHSISHSIWHSIWHFCLAFYLTYILTFYLEYILTSCLTYVLALYPAVYLTYILTFYLAFYLTFFLAYYLIYIYISCIYSDIYILAFFLAFCNLAFYLAYILAFYLAVEVQWCPLDSRGPRFRSSGAHWPRGHWPRGPRLRSSGWGQQCSLILRDVCWGPAAPTEIGSWRELAVEI